MYILQLPCNELNHVQAGLFLQTPTHSHRKAPRFACLCPQRALKLPLRYETHKLQRKYLPLVLLLCLRYYCLHIARAARRLTFLVQGAHLPPPLVQIHILLVKILLLSPHI